MKWIVTFWVGLSWGITLAQKPAPQKPTTKNPTETNNSTSGVGTVAPTPGQTYALIVGISNYKFVDPLRYADKDAEAFSQYLLSPAGGSVPQANITLLTNEKASLAQIIKALDDLVEVATSRDQVIIFFSGHGDEERISEANRGYLLAYDTFSDYYQFGALRLEDFEAYVKKLSLTNQANVWVFLDACRSGKLIGNSIGGAKITAREMAKTWGKEIKILSCQPDEYSLESQVYQNGLFTYYLIRGLQGLADSDKNGLVSLRELRRYLEDTVTPNAQHLGSVEQNPDCIGNVKIQLSKVDISTLTALKKGEQLPSFTPIKGISNVDRILKKAYESDSVFNEMFKKAYQEAKQKNDTIGQNIFSFAQKPVGLAKRYKEFQDRLKDGRAPWTFTELYLDNFIANPLLREYKNYIKREFVASLFEHSQQLINTHLRSKSNSTDNNWMISLPKAIQLIDSSHILYSQYKIQELFVNGLLASNFQLKNKITAPPETYFKQILGIDSTLAFVHQELAMLYLERADTIIYEKDSLWQLAEKSFLHAVKYAPNWAYLHNNLGSLYKEMGRLDDALKCFFRVIELKPDYEAPYSNIGIIYKNRGENQKAIEFHTKALAISPNSPVILSNLGSVYHSIDKAKALECYQKALKIDPTYMGAYFNIGNVYFEESDFTKAEQAYLEAIRLNPKYAESYLKLGNLYCKSIPPKYEVAEKNYLHYIVLNPLQVDGYYNLGVMYESLNLFDKAEAICRKGLLQTPNEAILHFALGDVFTHRSTPDHEQSIVEYQKAIELNPKYIEAYINLGLTYTYMPEKKAEALSTYQKALKINPKNTLIYTNMAYVYAMSPNSDFDGAMKCYETAISISPQDAKIFAKKGSLCLELGKYQEAEQAFTEAIKINPNKADFYYDLGVVYKRMLQFEASLNAVKHYTELNPQDHQGYIFIAILYASLDKKIEALVYLEKALQMGYNDLDVLLSNEETILKTLRALPQFNELVRKYKK